jgi:hypothetical protein
MKAEILELVNSYWKFDDNQQPVSNWHDKQDLLKAIDKLLSQYDLGNEIKELNRLISIANEEKREQEAKNYYNNIKRGNIPPPNF